MDRINGAGGAAGSGPWRSKQLPTFDDDGVPKWAPKFLRIAKDHIKMKPKFTDRDITEIQFFAHYWHMLIIAVSFWP